MVKLLKSPAIVGSEYEMRRRTFVGFSVLGFSPVKIGGLIIFAAMLTRCRFVETRVVPWSVPKDVGTLADYSNVGSSQGNPTTVGGWDPGVSSQ